MKLSSKNEKSKSLFTEISDALLQVECFQFIMRYQTLKYL